MLWNAIVVSSWAVTTLKPAVSRLWLTDWLTDLWQGNLRPDSLDTLLRPGWSFSEKTKSLAGHRCCASAKRGWQQLPLRGQRVTLGDALFLGGTLCLCLQRRLEGWADLVLRGAEVFWVNTWCKTKTQATNTGQPSGGDPIVSPLLVNRHEKERAVPLCSWTVGSPRALSWMHHTARSGSQSRQRVSAINSRLNMPLPGYKWFLRMYIWGGCRAGYSTITGLVLLQTTRQSVMERDTDPTLLVMVKPSVCEWTNQREIREKHFTHLPFNIPIMQVLSRSMHKCTGTESLRINTTQKLIILLFIT